MQSHHQCCLYWISNISPCCEWGRRKEKGHTIPLAPCAKSSCSPTPGTQDWVCGSPLMGVLSIRVCCVLQQETSYSDMSHCLVRSKNALIRKSCIFLNNVTAPIPDCILNLAGGWGQGSCCPCTRSCCQLGPWHWGLKALSLPWEVLCPGSRWYHFRDDTSPLAQLSWCEKAALSLQGV